MKLKAKFKKANQVIGRLLALPDNVVKPPKIFKLNRLGDTLASACEGNIWMNPDIPYGEIEKIMCHEFVHLDQMATGRLRFNSTGFIWCGNFYHMNSLAYYDQPWEIEAYRIGPELQEELKYV
jgi:hypothetical protein